MKTWMVMVVTLLGFTTGWIVTDLVRSEFKRAFKEQEERIVKAVQTEVDGVYEAVALNNVTQGNILDHHGRMLHYIAGHNSNKFVKFCPECGLLEQLAIRKKKIDDRIFELSEKIAKNPEASNESEKKELNELTLEANLATQKIFSADERAKDLSKLMNNVKSD